MSEVVTGFGQKGVSAETVAGALVKEINAHQASEGALGQHLADQWMLPLALAVMERGGEAAFTCTEMTEHATTNIGVIERFLPVRFDVDSTGACPRVRVVAAERVSNDAVGLRFGTKGTAAEVLQRLQSI